MRTLIRELCPLWGNIKIASKGKYLGFIIGPRADADSWNAPIAKFKKRVRELENMKCGMLWNSLYYNMFAVTTLEFVAQLEDVPNIVIEAEDAAMRKLAKGPGNWITLRDLENLDQYGIGKGFRLIRYTSGAAKLRVLREVGRRRIQKMEDELISNQCNYLVRPSGTWHYRSFISRLRQNETLLNGTGITIKGILMESDSKKNLDFQKKTRAQISKQDGNSLIPRHTSLPAV
jgi:hypothetical protein